MVRKVFNMVANVLAGFILITCTAQPPKTELSIYTIPLDSEVKVENSLYPSVSFTIYYVENRKLPLLHDVRILYTWRDNQGIQTRENLDECDRFPCEEKLESNGEIRFSIGYRAHKEYIELYFPPGWYLSK